MVLLILKLFTPKPLSSLSQHAPLRALRVGIGLVLCSALAAGFVPGLSGDGAQNESILVWIILTLTLTGLAAGIILSRSATSVLLQVALEHGLRQNVRRSLELAVAACDGVGPFLGGFIFAWAFAQGMQYPMDSTFVFNLCAVLAVGLYTGSLVLHVQVVGDFGSAPEGSTLPQDLVLPHSCCERYCPRCCGPVVSALSCLEELVIVPSQDIKDFLVDVEKSERSDSRRTTTKRRSSSDTDKDM